LKVDGFPRREIEAAHMRGQREPRQSVCFVDVFCAGPGGYDSGGNNHSDKGQSDQKVVHGLFSFVPAV
jgi:hypothetical protein